MKIKFVKGIHGFIYDSVYGDITQIFDKPISKKERKTMNKVISEDDMLFLEEDIEDIEDMWLNVAIYYYLSTIYWLYRFFIDDRLNL